MTEPAEPARHADSAGPAPVGAPSVVRHTEEVMGTVFSFDVRGGDPDAVRRTLAEAVARLHEVDEVFSTYREHSQISRLARGELSVAECDPEVAEVLALGAEAERRSEGWFSLRYEGRLDPTGIVKGWACERAARALSAAGTTGVSVNGGGDVQVFGVPGRQRPWRVGISDPLRPGALAAVVSAAGTDRLAVATSGTAERGAHIVDPRTSRSAVTDLVAVTVVSPASPGRTPGPRRRSRWARARPWPGWSRCRTRRPC